MPSGVGSVVEKWISVARGWEGSLLNNVCMQAFFFSAQKSMSVVHMRKLSSLRCRRRVSCVSVGEMSCRVEAPQNETPLVAVGRRESVEADVQGALCSNKLFSILVGRV